MFFRREKMAGLHHTEDRAGEAPKTQFFMKSFQTTKSQHPVNHKQNQLFRQETSRKQRHLVHIVV